MEREDLEGVAEKNGCHVAIFLKESRLTGPETASNTLQINVLHTEFCVELGWRQRDSSLDHFCKSTFN